MLHLSSITFRQYFEGAFSVLDPKLSINWPLEIENMSPRDEAHPFIDEEFKGIKI